MSRESLLQDLRMKYNAAHSAYRTCARAVAEASMSGSMDVRALQERESAALRELDEARARLLAALAENDSSAAGRSA